MILQERITNALRANQIILSMKHGQVIKTHLVKIDRLLGDIRQDLAKPVEFNKNGAQKKEKKDLTVKDLKKAFS